MDIFSRRSKGLNARAQGGEMILSMQTAAEYAKTALQIAWDGSLPVKPDVIASSLVVHHKDDTTGAVRNVPIKVRRLGSAELNGVSGQASLESDSEQVVFYCDYNGEEISYRNRFTVAHELGHVLLGHVDEGNPKHRDTTFGNYNPIERAANAFAAELVMPERKVRELFGGARSVRQMSEAFGVSNAAMSFRLQNLGLL